ncbi:hypothetical protein BGW36DRAFT_426405 [Talaromyces proteolyticus]|uniref:C2H2-type domain-containing protein n=1 Tax=Talaromyces proteolyticus TaxID=1131652 RepID=A0AAD4Q1M9_9EURO|nr:uncharacterized protein BGW36DRAFT_426405 [Talaromyces proteolyticus]KAH8698713.1 hypothetical protein BGW36DRAFT_426405 [Talaromyces proteolyticus]
MDRPRTGLVSTGKTCDYCGRLFTKTNHLERHLRSHTKEKPFRCDNCGRQYSRQDSLLRHQRTHRRVPGAPPSLRPDEGNSADPLCASDNSSDHHASIATPADSSLSNTIVAPTLSYDIELPDELLRVVDFGTSVDLCLPSNALPQDVFLAAFSSDYVLDDLHVDETTDLHKSTASSDCSHDRTNSEVLASCDLSSSSVKYFVESTGDFPSAATTTCWFSQLGLELAEEGSIEIDARCATRCATELNELLEISDTYRLDLGHQLGWLRSQEPLPSTEFLNLCIQRYFTYFNPAFPVLHGPTFQPSPEKRLLLLSVCAVGSMFIGTIAAAQKGAMIFERLNQAIHGSDPHHLATVSAFHGTGIAMARRAKIFGMENKPFSTEGLEGAKLAEAWHAWARQEEIKRSKHSVTALGLFVHDAEMSTLLHDEPILRHRVKTIPLASCTDPFSARAANTWAQLIKQDPSAASTYPLCSHTGGGNTTTADSIQVSDERCSHSMFTAYMLLEGIGASICEDRVLDQLDHGTTQRYQRDLMSWYSRYRRPIMERSDPLCLLILWHTIWMSLLAEFHGLELAIGQEGPSAAALSMPVAVVIPRWSVATDAQRCLLHALLLQKRLESVPMGRAKAIHVPRCLFAAAVAWAGYLACSSSNAIQGPLWSSVEPLISWPEIQLLASDVDLDCLQTFGSRTGNLAFVKANTLCILVDLLRQLGCWGIAQKFTHALEPLIHPAEG